MLNFLLVDRLIEILESEAEVYNRFLELSKKKTEIVISGDVVKLGDITKKEHILTNEMSKFEEEREQLMIEIIPYLNENSSVDSDSLVDEGYLPVDNDSLEITSSEVTITSIIEYMKKISRVSEPNELHGKTNYTMQIEKLEKCKNSIISIVEELKEVNKINSELINNSLEYINFSINLMTSVSEHGTKYGNNGKEGNVERRSLFDVKL